MIEKVYIKNLEAFDEYLKEHCRNTTYQHYYVYHPAKYPCIGLLESECEGLGCTYTMEDFVYLDDFK